MNKTIWIEERLFGASEVVTSWFGLNKDYLDWRKTIWNFRSEYLLLCVTFEERLFGASEVNILRADLIEEGSFEANICFMCYSIEEELFGVS